MPHVLHRFWKDWPRFSCICTKAFLGRVSLAFDGRLRDITEAVVFRDSGGVSTCIDLATLILLARFGGEQGGEDGGVEGGAFSSEKMILPGRDSKGGLLRSTRSLTSSTEPLALSEHEASGTTRLRLIAWLSSACSLLL